MDDDALRHRQHERLTDKSDNPIGERGGDLWTGPGQHFENRDRQEQGRRGFSLSSAKTAQDLWQGLLKEIHVRLNAG